MTAAAFTKVTRSSPLWVKLAEPVSVSEERDLLDVEMFTYYGLFIVHRLLHSLANVTIRKGRRWHLSEGTEWRVMHARTRNPP